MIFNLQQKILPVLKSLSYLDNNCSEIVHSVTLNANKEERLNS